jgi:hypothetical protein
LVERCGVDATGVEEVVKKDGSVGTANTRIVSISLSEELK